MASGKYERELKKILSGIEEQIKKSTKSCSDGVREKYKVFSEMPLLVNRGAGSLGVDLMAVRANLNYIIEVKASSSKTIYLNGRLDEQRQKIKKMGEQFGIISMYAFRLKHEHAERWKVFGIDIDHLPSLAKTTQGGYKLEWEDGMYLSEFASDFSTRCWWDK